MLHTAYLATASPALAGGTKNLLCKAAGRFYTPEAIGMPLVADVIKRTLRRRLDTVNLVDPFCGDSRLLIWSLRALIASGNKSSVNLHEWEHRPGRS